MKRPEDIVQRAVVQHLTLRRVPGVTWFAVPNGGQRSKIEAGIMKGLGVRAGVPDVAVIINGIFHGLELKPEKGGVVSAHQKAMMAEITGAGGVCAVAHGLDEALRYLEEWGAIAQTVVRA